MLEKEKCLRLVAEKMLHNYILKEALVICCRRRRWCVRTRKFLMLPYLCYRLGSAIASPLHPTFITTVQVVLACNLRVDENMIYFTFVGCNNLYLQCCEQEGKSFSNNINLLICLFNADCI